jgi:hypothetical protein
MGWSEDVSDLADRLAATGLRKRHVSAIVAGFDDVEEGLRKLLDYTSVAVNTKDRDDLVEAIIELDDHLRPHLRDMSKALKALDSTLSRRSR